MKTSFTTTIIALFIGTTLAMPANIIQNRQAGLCSSSLGSPQCCDVDVLGVADLNCEQPPTIPTSLPEFEDICASIGKIDMCCVLPILGQALLCADGS